MASNKEYVPDQPPKNAKGDVAFGITKAALAAIPLVGGPAVELVEALLKGPINARRDEWLESIATELHNLIEGVDDLSLEKLSEDPSFITTFMSASQIAMRTHQEEKREALRNAVLNAALRTEPDEDLQAIFLGLVDRFTSWHLRILNLLNDPVASANAVNFKPSGSLGSIQTLITGVYPELEEHAEFYQLIYSELMAAGLMVSGPIGITTMSNAMFQKRSTAIGIRFLRFISRP